MADRSQLPSVTQYTKNVLKSTLYASSGVAENLMPGYLEFKETNKEVFKAAYVAIRDYRKTFQKVKDAITKSKVYEAADVALKNIKSDLRTGMWYNKGREVEYDNQAMMSGDDFGLSEMTGGKGGSSSGGGGDLGFGDIDINMDDIFGDDENAEEDLDISDGDALIADTVKKTSAKSTASINDIQIRGIDALMKSNRAAANMAYIQNEKMMKITEEGFSTLNTTASNLLKFNTEGLQKHLENAANYYTNTEKLAQERNAMLKELLEMQRNIYAMYQIESKNKDDNSNKPKKYTWGTISTNSGMPALEEYFGAIKQNLERELDNAGMGMIKAMGGLAGDNPLLAFAQNPLGDIVTTLVTTALGPTLAKASKGLDRTMSSMFGNFISRMNGLGEEGEGPLSFIGKILGIRDIAKNTLGPENYKRGPMPWDGEAKKALVEVIPHYLANIEAALTGRHQLFDYQTGRYVDSAALKEQYLSIVDRYRYQPFSDVNQLMRKFFGSFRQFEPEEQKKFVETWVNMQKYASAGKGRWSRMFNFDTSKPREDEEELEDLAMETNSEKKYVRAILNYFKAFTGKGDKNNPVGKIHGNRGILTDVDAKILESRERQTKDFENMEQQGSILTQLFNNGYMQYRDTKGILRNNTTMMDRMHLKYQKDERGNNIFYYLQRILGSLMLIQTEGFGVGDIKQMKEEQRLREQRRKIHRGQKTDNLITSSPTKNGIMNRIEGMFNNIRDDEWRKDKTADQLHSESERKMLERQREKSNEMAIKQKEDIKAGKKKDNSPMIIGINRNDVDWDTYTTIVDAGVRNMHERNAEEEELHDAEMRLVMERLMMKEAKDEENRNESDKTWLGRQYAKFKNSNEEEDKKYRAEIQKQGFLDALLSADDLGDKWGTIRVGLEDLAEKPSMYLTKVLEEADERLYQFFFTEEEIMDKRTGKKYKGFFGRLKAHLDNLFIDMNDGLNKYLFQPLKDKLGVEGPWDAVKKGLNYIGIDVDAIGAEIKDNMGEGLKSVWENIKETFTEFFSDAAEAIAEDERKARELEEGKKTYTEELVDKVTSSSSSDKKEEKKEEKKKSKIRTIFDDPNSTLEQKAEALRISRDIIQNSSPAELRMIVDEKMRKYNKHIGYDVDTEIENIKNNMRFYDTRTMTNEDRKKAMEEYDRLISLSSDMMSKKLAIQEIMKLENRDDKRSRDLDKEIKYILKGLADIENKLNKPDEYNIDELNDRKEIAEGRLARLQEKKNKLFTIGDDRRKQYQELLSFIDNSLFGTESEQKTELNPISELRDKRTNSVKMTGIQRAMKMKSHIDHLAETKFKEGDFDLYSDLNREQIKMMDEFVKANPGYVFDRHENYIKNWIENALNVKNKAAVSAIVNKMKSDFVKDPNHDIKKVFQFKFLKGIVDDIVKAYEDRNFDISSGGVDARVGQAVKDSIASQRLESFNQDEDVRDYMWSAEIVEPFTESINEAAQGITDLNELIKVSLNEDSPIYKKLDEILNALKSNQEQSYIDDSLIDEYSNRLGFAEGRESLELAPAETAIVSKGEIIKPLVGPSEKITKTGLYNLGRGDAVIPNPSKATVERNKVEEANKLDQITSDISRGKDISKHMATTKQFALGRGIFNIDTGDSDNVEVTENEDKDTLINLSIGYAKGRDNIYDLDSKKGQEDYVNSIVKALTEDLPKYAESRPPVRIEATDEAKLNYILSNKNRFISKEFDPEQIAILSAIIKGEKEDNKYKKNEGRVLSNISDMYGYLLNSIDTMTEGKNDDEDIKIGDKTVSVKELKNIRGFIARSRQTAFNEEFKNGISSSVVGKLVADGINNIKEGAIDVLTGITGLDSENVKKSVKETYAEVKKGMPNVIAKGTVGLIGGTLLGGPLVGALLGSAVGVAQSSETFRTTLFGTVSKRDEETGKVLERNDDGLISKETVEAYKKYMPGIKGYGLLGTALGLVTPFGLLGGALLGAGFGAISRTDEFQETFFGKKGIFDKDTRDFFKKAAPNAAASAAAMAFLGPFGLVGNIAVGSMLGLAGSTEQFKTYLFGAEDRHTGKRNGGIVGALKEGVVDPWLEFGKKVSKDLFEWVKTDVFAPLKGAIAPIGKQIQLGLTGLVKGLGHVIDHWAKVILGKPITVWMQKWMERISGGMTKALGWVLSPIKKIASAPFKLIGGIGDVLRRRQIQMGNADYMSAAERMKFRQENAMNQEDQWSSFDEKIATASSKNIQNVLDVARLMETGGKDLEKSKDQSTKELWATISNNMKRNGKTGFKISPDEKAEIEKLILSGNSAKITEASNRISDLMGDVAGKDEVLGKIEEVAKDVSSKQMAISNFKNYGVDATVKLFREHLGIEADSENIGKFRSMLEKELDVRKAEEAKLESGEMTKGESLLTNDSIRDQTAVLSEHLVNIKKVLEALAGGMLSQHDLSNLSKKYAGFDRTIVEAKEREMSNRLNTRDLLMEAFGEDVVNNMDKKSYDRLISDNPEFKGKLGHIFADMGKRNFRVSNMNKLTGQSDETIKKLITLFNKTGLQTEDYEALGELSDKELENIINAASTGLNIIDMKEAKDLDIGEADQIRNFRELTGLTDKHISTTVLKKLVRNGKMAVFNANPQAFIDEINAHREAFAPRLEGKGNLEKTGINRVRGTIKLPNPNTIGNRFLNSISTTGEFGGRVVGRALRDFGHDPIERYEGTTTIEETLSKFGSADMLKDYIAGGHRSAIERFLDPDNEKGTKAEADVVSRAVSRAKAKGMNNEQIENALNVKIKDAPDGGSIIDSHNTKAVKGKGENKGENLNKEIFELAEKYGMYDDRRRFMDMVMGDNRFQDKVVADLMQLGYTRDEIAGFLKSNQFRGGTTPKRRNIENILARANYTDNQISGFRTGNISEGMDKDIREILKINNITDEEIQNFKKGINGYAEGRLSSFINKTKEVVKDKVDPLALHLTGKDTATLLKDLMNDPNFRKYMIKKIGKTIFKELDLHHFYKEFSNKNLIKHKLEYDTYDKLNLPDFIQDSMSTYREEFANAVGDYLVQLGHQNLPKPVMNLLDSVIQTNVYDMIEKLDPNMLMNFAQSLQSMNVFAEGRPTFFDYHDDPDSESYWYSRKDSFRDKFKEAYKPKETASYSTPIISQALSGILANETSGIYDDYLNQETKIAKETIPVPNYTSRTNKMFINPVESSIIEIPNNKPNPNASIIIPGQQTTTGNIIILPGQENVNPNAKLIIPGQEKTNADLSSIILQQKQNETIKNLRQSSKLLTTMNSGVVDDLIGEEDIEVPKIEEEIKTKFEGLESENSLRFMVYNQIKKFNELGLTPNQDVLGKLDYKNGIAGLINSGFSMRKLFEYDPKNMEVKFTDVDDKEFKVSADFYENMTSEEQSNLIKSLISQAINKDNNGIVNIPTPDGDKQIKIADTDKPKTIQVPTMYGIKEQVLSSDKSYIDSGKDATNITEKINQDHDARLSTASDISEIKDFIFKKFGKKEKPKEEKKSFMEMLMDLLKLLAAFLIGGGLMALLHGFTNDFGALFARMLRYTLSLTERAIVGAIDKVANQIKNLAERIKVRLNISEVKVPGFRSGNLAKGAARGGEAALAARLAKIAATEGAGPKGKAYKALTAEETAELEALQKKGTLEAAEADRVALLSSKLAEEKEINAILNKIRTGGIASLSEEEFTKLSNLAANNSTLDRVATRLDNIAMAREAELNKAIRESARITNTGISDLTFGDIKSNIKEKMFGGFSLTDAELDRKAMRMADKGVSSEYILKSLGLEIQDGELVRSGGLSVERAGLTKGYDAAVEAAKNTKNFAKFMGEQVVDGTKAVGEAIGKQFERVGDKITSGFNTATQPIRNVGNAISQSITETASKVETKMLGQYTQEDMAKVVATMQEKGATNQEIINAVKEMQGSQRTVLGSIVDRFRGTGPMFEGPDLNFGDTAATVTESGEKGLIGKWMDMQKAIGESGLRGLAMAGGAAAGIGSAMMTPFSVAGKAINELDAGLAKDLGMKYNVASFAPRMLLGMPGFAVDSFKTVGSDAKTLLTGGLNKSMEASLADYAAMEERTVTATTKAGQFGQKMMIAGESILGPISRGISTFLGAIAQGIGTFLKFIPGVGKGLSKGFQKLAVNLNGAVAKSLSNTAASARALGLLGKLGMYYMVYDCIDGLQEGYGNPGMILHIKNQENIGYGTRVVAAIANLISRVFIGIIEPKTIADFVIETIGPYVGFGEDEIKQIQQEQESSEEEYKAWKSNLAEGADNSFEAFLKDTGNYQYKDMLTNVTDFVWDGVKAIANKIWEATLNLPNFISEKIKDGLGMVFSFSDKIDDLSNYWNKLSDRSNAIMNGLGKLDENELRRLDQGVEISKDDPLYGIKNTMKIFASNHWFIMGTLGWVIGGVGKAISGIGEGIGDFFSGLQSQLSTTIDGFIEGDPMKIINGIINGDSEVRGNNHFFGILGRTMMIVPTIIMSPYLAISTIVRTVKDAIGIVQDSFKAFPAAPERLNEMSKLADEGNVTAIWDIDSPFKNETGLGPTLGGIAFGLGKVGYTVLGAYNYVSNGIMKAVNSAMSWMAGKKVDFNWYDKYELKSWLDDDYINHSEINFDPKHPLTAIPSAVETIYKVMKYPFKLVAFAFKKFNEDGGIISGLISKARSIFGAMDDIEKQNKSMMNNQNTPKQKQTPVTMASDVMAPSVTMRSNDINNNTLDVIEGVKTLKRVSDYGKSLGKKELRERFTNIVEESIAEQRPKYEEVYNQDKKVVYMMSKIHEIEELKQNRDKVRKNLETAGFSIDDQTLEAMIYNHIRGKNTFYGYGKGRRGTGLINNYLQNAPGNEKIQYNIPGDTKVDTVAARACGPFAMGAAKDYVTGTPSDMNKELKLGRNYLAPDDGTKFDYFKDSGNRSGLDVKQTSNMNEIDKATKDPNSAVVGMVDTGRGIHYETFTDKVENKGKSYYNTIDPEKPLQTLSDKDTIGKQLKTSFIVKRANGRRGIYGKGNEMRIDPQSTGFNCTAYSTMAMLRAYYNEENDDSTVTTGNWAGIMDEFATETNFGNSESEKKRFVADINRFYDQHPNHPMLLYQTGGDGSYGNHPINHGGGSHATVIGRRLDNGLYEDYDPNGGIVHTLPLDEIFDSSALGGVQGMPSNAGNSVWIPRINPSSPIDKWQGTGESSNGVAASGGPRTDENGIIYNNAKTNTNSGSIFDRAITNSAPISNLTRLYNAIFGGDTGSSENITQINTPPQTLGDAINSESKKPSTPAQVPTDPNVKAELKHSDDKWEMVDNAAVFMSQYAKEKFGEDVPTWFWRTILRAESTDQGLPMNSYQANNWHNYGGMDYDSYMKEYGATPATEVSAHGHTRGVFPDMESGLKAEVAWFCRPEADEWWKSEIRAAQAEDWAKAIRLHIGHYVNGVEEEMSDNHYMVIAAEERARDNKGKGTYGRGISNIEGYAGPEINKITNLDSISIQKAKLQAQQKYMDNLTKKEQSRIWNTNIVNETVKSLDDKDRNDVLNRWSQGSKFIQYQDKAAKIIPFGTDVDTSDMTGSNKRTIDEAFNAKASLEESVIKKNGIPFVKGKNINQIAKDNNFLSEMSRRTFTPQYGKGYENYGDYSGSDIEQRAKFIWSYLKSNGMSDAGAAGVIGNFRVEDPPLDPAYAEGGSVHKTLEEHIAAGGVGYGLAQWTYPSRQDNLIEYAKSKGLSSGSLEAQLGFTQKEATEGYGNIWGRFANETDPVQAAKTWMDEYESPGVPHWDRRSEEATNAYNMFSGQTYDNIQDPSIGGTSPSSGGSVAGGALGLIDKILLPAIDKAIDQVGYADMIKEQYGIDVKGSQIFGLTSGSTPTSPTADDTTPTDTPASNGGAASGDSVGQAMLNFVPGSEITSQFGPRTLNGSDDFHNGIDIGYAGDTPVYSPITATVDGADYEKGYGNYVVLKDSDGKYYMFGHLNAHSVKTGQTVKPGDQLGLSGNTGHSFGDHLHFGVHSEPMCYKDPNTSFDPMTYPLGKGTRKEEILDNLNTISSGLDDITVDDMDNTITANRIESGKYGTGILPIDNNLLSGLFSGIVPDVSNDNTEEDRNDETPTISNIEDYIGTPYVGNRPNRLPSGLNLPGIDDISGGLDLGGIFGNSNGIDLGGIFKGIPGLGDGGEFENPLGNIGGLFGGLDLGGIFGNSNGIDLGGIFKGGIEGISDGGFDLGNMFGDKSGLIGTAGGFIADWFNRRNERRKEKQERMKNFEYYTINSDNIPEGMPSKYLIDPSTELETDKKTQKKIRKQFEFMDKNGYLNRDGSIKNGDQEEVQDTKLPDATKDIDVTHPTDTNPIKLPDHTEEEEEREIQKQEVKPPTAPRINENSEEIEEDQAKRDIVNGTGYHDHLEAKIGETTPTNTGFGSDSNFEKLLSVLNTIAENTGKLIELAGNNGGSNNTNINMNSNSISANVPPTNSRSGRNHINDMMAMANNFLNILKK